MIFFRIFILSFLFIYSNPLIGSYKRDIWRYHLNLKDIKKLFYYENKLYCFADRGFFNLDLESRNIVKNSVDLNLSGVDIIESLKYNNHLIFIYSSGYVDFIKGNQVYSINLDLTANATINSANKNGSNIFISTTEGVYVVDAENKILMEKYEYIHNSKKKISVSFLDFFENKIYVASGKNIYFSNFNSSNSLDYRSWDELSFFNDSIIGSFKIENQIYFYDSNSIFSITGNNMDLKIEGDILSLKFLNNLLHILYKKDQSTFLSVQDKNSNIVDLKLPQGLQVNDFNFYDENIWLVGNGFSLYNLNEQIFYSPENYPVKSINKIYADNGFVYAFSNTNKFSKYKEGQWESESLVNFNSISSVALGKNDKYFGSFSDGVLDYNNQIIIDENYPESKLKRLENSSKLVISDLDYVNEKLWILNYGSDTPLISWDNINWESYTIGSGFYHYPQELIFNNLETFWIINDKNKFGGITLFDINIKAKYHLSVSNNKLKSNNINSVTVDKNNYVWVGSDQGVFYYNYSSLDDVKQIGSYLTPNDGNKNIFQNIMINDILIDNSNNKWIGTDQGIFVFDSNKNKIINSFNKDNSPIPSDNIISLKTTESGEIFILTDYGLISYNTYNEMPKPNYSDLKIYPNPITISNDQSIIISGLVDKNIIHITNQSGRLVFSDVYEGGGLVWDLKDSDKIKISPGIYLVFILSEDGSRELIEKILVI